MDDFSHLISKDYFRTSETDGLAYILDDIAAQTYTVKQLAKLYPKVSQNFIEDHVNVLSSSKQDNYFYRVVGHHYFNRLREAYCELIEGATDIEKEIDKLSRGERRGIVDIRTRFVLYEDSCEIGTDGIRRIFQQQPDALRSVIKYTNTQHNVKGLSSLYFHSARKNILWCRFERNHTAMVLNHHVDVNTRDGTRYNNLTYDDFLSLTSSDRVSTKISRTLDKTRLGTYTVDNYCRNRVRDYEYTQKYQCFEVENVNDYCPENQREDSAKWPRAPEFRRCLYRQAPHSLFNPTTANLYATYHVYPPQSNFTFNVRSLVEVTTLCRALNVFTDRFSETKIRQDNGNIVAFALDPETNNFAVQFGNGKTFYSTYNYDRENTSRIKRETATIHTYPLQTEQPVNVVGFKSAFARRLATLSSNGRLYNRAQDTCHSMSVLFEDRSKFIVEIARDRLFVVYEIDMNESNAVQMRDAVIRSYEETTTVSLDSPIRLNCHEGNVSLVGSGRQKQNRRQRSTRNVKDRDIKLTLYSMMHGIHDTGLLNVLRHSYIPTLICNRDLPFFRKLHESLANMREFQKRINLRYRAICAYSTQPNLVGIDIVAGRRVLSCATTTKISMPDRGTCGQVTNDPNDIGSLVQPCGYKFTKKSLHLRNTMYNLAEQTETVRRYLGLGEQDLTGQVEEFIDYDLVDLLYACRARDTAYVIMRWNTESTQFDLVSTGRANPSWSLALEDTSRDSTADDMLIEYSSFRVIFLESSEELSIIQKKINAIKNKQFVSICGDTLDRNSLTKQAELEQPSRDTGKRERVRFLEAETAIFSMNRDVAMLLSISNNHVNRTQAVSRPRMTSVETSTLHSIPSLQLSFLDRYGIKSLAVERCRYFEKHSSQRGTFTLYYYVCSLNSRFWGLGLLFYETQIARCPFTILDIDRTLIVNGIPAEDSRKSFTYVFTNCIADTWTRFVNFDKNDEFALVYSDNPMIYYLAKYCASVSAYFEDPRTPFYNLATLFVDYDMNKCFLSCAEETMNMVNWATVESAICLDSHYEYEFTNREWNCTRKFRCTELKYLLSGRFLLVHCCRGSICDREYTEKDPRLTGRLALLTLTRRSLKMALHFNLYTAVNDILQSTSDSGELNTVEFKTEAFVQFILYKMSKKNNAIAPTAATMLRVFDHDENIFGLLVRKSLTRMFRELITARDYSTLTAWVKSGICDRPDGQPYEKRSSNGNYELMDIMKYIEKIIKPHYTCKEISIDRAHGIISLPLVLDNQENVDKIYRNGFAWKYEKETRNKTKSSRNTVRSYAFPDPIKNVS
ncbi:U28-like protein [Lissonota sp. PSUC_FEM 10030012]|nr:U28-like protein [Lissonota sp. PSUC_FEM 10030012]